MILILLHCRNSAQCCFRAGTHCNTQDVETWVFSAKCSNGETKVHHNTHQLLLSATPQQPCPRSEVNRYCNFTATNPCNPQKPIYTTSIDLCEVARTLWQSLSSQYTATNQISQAPREKNASAATNWVHRLVAVRKKSEHWAQFCLNSDQWVHPQKSIYGT